METLGPERSSTRLRNSCSSSACFAVVVAKARLACVGNPSTMDRMSPRPLGDVRVRAYVLVLGLALGLLSTTKGRTARAEPRHAAYVEVLGKGGLWGLGYDFLLARRVAVGAVGSYYVLGGNRFTTVSPYLAGYPVRGAHHGWFVHGGPQIVRRTTPSPVPEWSGAS